MIPIQYFLLVGLSIGLLTAVLTVSLLILGLRMFLGSTMEAGRTILVFGLVALTYPVSWVATSVRLIGRIFSLSDFYRRVFGLYPGYWFADKLRADFVEQGVQYLKAGTIQLDEEREAKELREFIQKTHRVSGKAISDGEAAFAVGIAFVGLFPFIPEWTITILSIGLIVAVATRVTTMESLLFEVPEEEMDTNRLEVILGWNESIVNSGSLFRIALILRIMYDLDGRIYEQYLYKVMHENFVRDGMDRIDAADTFLPVFRVIAEARMRGVEAETLSEEMYGKNVLRIPSCDESSGRRV